MQVSWSRETVLDTDDQNHQQDIEDAENGEEFFTITEGDVIHEPAIRQPVGGKHYFPMNNNLLEHLDNKLEGEEEEVDDNEDMASTQFATHATTDSSGILKDIEKNATVWGLLQAQVQKDFGPLVLLADQFGLSKQVRSLGFALRNIFVGGLLPMMSVAFRVVKYIGDAISNSAGGVLNLISDIEEEAKKDLLNLPS